MVKVLANTRMTTILQHINVSSQHIDLPKLTQYYTAIMGFLGGSNGEKSACNAGDVGSIPGLGRSTGEGNGYPLQYSCMENSMDRGAHGVTESDTTELLNCTIALKGNSQLSLCVPLLTTFSSTNEYTLALCVFLFKASQYTLLTH